MRNVFNPRNIVLKSRLGLACVWFFVISQRLIRRRERDSACKNPSECGVSCSAGLNFGKRAQVPFGGSVVCRLVDDVIDIARAPFACVFN